MKIAVTAASGRLGHATLRALAGEITAGSLVGVARSPERIHVPGIERRAGDYESVESMTAALEGIHTALMISAPVVGASDRLALHRNVIEAARRAGVQALLYTSVVGNGRAEGTYFFPTQQAGRQTEAAVAESGLDWMIARNGLYLELDLEHIIAANREGVYRNPGGDGRCPYITIDELAYGMARLATGSGHYGKIHNLVGECWTQAEIVAAANAVFGLNVRYEPMSDEACIQHFLRIMPERGEAVARMLTGCFQCIRAGAFEVPSDFQAATGRQARTLRQMMEDCRRKRETAAG